MIIGAGRIIHIITNTSNGQDKLLKLLQNAARVVLFKLKTESTQRSSLQRIRTEIGTALKFTRVLSVPEYIHQLTQMLTYQSNKDLLDVFGDHLLRALKALSLESSRLGI